MKISAISHNYSMYNSLKEEPKPQTEPSFQAKKIVTPKAKLTFVTLLGGLGILGLNKNKEVAEVTEAEPLLTMEQRIENATNELMKIKNYKKSIDNAKFLGIEKQYSVTPENIDFVEKFLNNDFFSKNESLRFSIPFIIQNINDDFNDKNGTNAEQRTNMAIALLELFEYHKENDVDGTVANKIGRVIHNVIASRAEGLELAAEWIKDKNLHTNQEYTETFILFLYGMEPSGVLTKMLLSDDRLYKNKNLRENLTDIRREIKDEETAKIKASILELYLSKPEYYENPNVIAKVGNVIKISDSDSLENGKMYLDTLSRI